MRPLILLSNDDGVHAPGIRALAEAVRTFADVVVVAPHVERSGAGHGISLTVPLRAEKLSDSMYAVEGTPADCVIFALNRVVPRRPDFVISGINRGLNIGQDTLYSGTVAAAMEGALQGIPAMAVSLRTRRHDGESYGTAAEVVKMLFAEPERLAPAKHAVLNVNVPDVPLAEIRGFRVATLGRRIYDAQFVEQHDPRGRAYYWIGGGGAQVEHRPGSDCTLMMDNYVTLTALTPDHANLSVNDALRPLLEGHVDDLVKRRRCSTKGQ